jgi:3-hydroxyacyl-CoA dehydrogenase
MPDPERIIAILGCGLIGESWAALCMAHGHDVQAWDPDAGARADFADRVARPIRQLADINGPAPRLGALTVHADLAEALHGATLIQENAPENVPLKQELYARIETLADPAAIIASSTSAHPWSALTPGMARPGRLITAHPFNPPHLIPLVEPYGIDDAVLARAEAFYLGLGRVPIRLNKDAVGHVANRLASALWREAVHIVAEGIADVAAVDAALVNGPGLRWSVLGAHMAYHLGGGAGGMAGYLAHLGPSQMRRWESLGSPELTPAVQALLVAGVADEAAGRTIAELEAERDARLIALARLRNAQS